MNDINKQKSGSLKDSVLNRIEQEGITPRSRLYWLSHDYALWAAWIFSVAFGALSVAVISFASLHIGYAIYEATHDNFFTFLMESMPYLWLLTFLLLSAAAYFNLRHTRRGYRYPVILVLGSSIGFSVLAGACLQYLGAGYYFDQFLGDVIPQYQSRAEFEAEMWQKPALGRIVGQVESIDKAVIDGAVSFTDIDSQKWHLNTEALPEHDEEMLRSGKKVRVLIATTTAAGTQIDYACVVLPWLFDHPPVLSELREDRHQFEQEVETRKEKIVNRMETVEDNVKKLNPNAEIFIDAIEKIPAAFNQARPEAIKKPEEADFDKGSPCASLAVFKSVKIPPHLISR